MFRWLRYPKLYVEFADKSVVLKPRRNGIGLDLPIADSLTIEPFGIRIISTGIKIALSPRYHAIVLPCEKTAWRHNLIILPQIIEPGYDEIIYVSAFNVSSGNAVVITPKTLPIAQLVIARRRVFDIAPVPSIKEIHKWFGLYNE